MKGLGLGKIGYLKKNKNFFTFPTPFFHLACPVNEK